jgi:hypothetical protein
LSFRDRDISRVFVEVGSEVLEDGEEGVGVGFVKFFYDLQLCIFNSLVVVLVEVESFFGGEFEVGFLSDNVADVVLGVGCGGQHLKDLLVFR